MFRRIVFLTIMLMLIPTFANANTVLRVEGARAYLLGFLGGDGEIYSSSPAIRDDTLFTLRRMAYPLSTWSWVQAVIENSSVQGDVVTLTVSRPDIANFMNNSLPESVKEWKGYLSLTNVEVPIKKEEVKLKVNSLGEVDISKETLKYMLQAVEDDIIEALDWCAKNPKDAPSVYVLSLRAEARHGIVPLPEKIKSKIEETAKILEGGKK